MQRSTSHKPVKASAASSVLILLLTAILLLPPASGQQASGQDKNAVIKVTTELVLANVTVRDKSGKFVRNLKAEDFTILEDNKPQKIASFDFEDVDAAQPIGPDQATVLGPRPQSNAPAATTSREQINEMVKHHRLIVLFFDLSSMEPDDTDRAVAAAQKYVDTQMSPADLVGVVSLADSFQVNLDFSADRDQLRKVLNGFSSASGQGFQAGSTGDTEGTADTAGSYTVDDTEYNIFNVDRRLDALRSLAAMLSRIEQKKSIIYISNGMTVTGIENQSELRAAVNDAVRANLSIYTLDVRGLQAMVPGGDAQSASLRGTAAYSGASTRNAFDSNFASQETLVTLAADTGGKAFLDTNDLNSVFKGVQQDTATYYVLGFHSTNQARDGRYRHVTVKVNIPNVKLEYRPGYYAPRDFLHFDKEDRERQLDEELASDIPSTDLRVFLSDGYFRLRDDKIYTSISLLVPGSEIPFTRSKDQDKASLDISGIVQDEAKRAVGRIRQTISVAMPETSPLSALAAAPGGAVPEVHPPQRKNVQYNTSFTLAPGKYHLKLVLRENQSGKIGSFQTDLLVPDFKTAPVKASSILLAGQKEPVTKKQNDNPLTRDGAELIPNVTHVFSQKQHMYLYYEVYDPAKNEAPKAGQDQRTDAGVRGGDAKGGDNAQGIHVMTNVLFFNGKVKAYETPLVEARSLNVENRHAAVFQLDIPLATLRPGYYTCQVNLIDDAGGRFIFRRVPVKLIQ